jgi:hypothetical protein
MSPSKVDCSLVTDVRGGERNPVGSNMVEPLPAKGRQWSWRLADPLEHISVRLPRSLLAIARQAARWRDIPSAGLIRRSFEVGLPIVLEIMERETGNGQD